jgi:hypothetical protein
MPSRLSRPAVNMAAAGLCLVASAAARAQQPRSLSDRYTEPIQIFKVGLGTFTKPMSSTHKDGGLPVNARTTSPHPMITLEVRTDDGKPTGRRCGSTAAEVSPRASLCAMSPAASPSHV